MKADAEKSYEFYNKSKQKVIFFSLLIW